MKSEMLLEAKKEAMKDEVEIKNMVFRRLTRKRRMKALKRWELRNRLWR